MPPALPEGAYARGWGSAEPSRQVETDVADSMARRVTVSVRAMTRDKLRRSRRTRTVSGNAAGRSTEAPPQWRLTEASRKARVPDRPQYSLLSAPSRAQLAVPAARSRPQSRGAFGSQGWPPPARCWPRSATQATLLGDDQGAVRSPWLSRRATAATGDETLETWVQGWGDTPARRSSRACREGARPPGRIARQVMTLLFWRTRRAWSGQEQQRAAAAPCRGVGNYQEPAVPDSRGAKVRSPASRAAAAWRSS
jgi:hypothetical protein